MPTVKQSDNPNNSLTVAGLDSDEFVPKVSLLVSKIDTTDEKIKCTLDKNEDIELSEYLDNGYRNNQTVNIETSESEITLPFEIIKGNRESDDDKGIITVTLFKELEDGTTSEIKGVKITSESEFETTYGSTHSVKLEIKDLKELTDFYIDFYAKDDYEEGWWWWEDDVTSGKLTNIHCGRVKLSIIPERKGIFPVEIKVLDKKIGEGILRPYPNSDGNSYGTPIYEMTVSGKDDKYEEKIYTFKVIRFGIQRDLGKGITEARVVGLANQQEYVLNWDQATMHGEGSWRVYDNFLVHRGAEYPELQPWGAIGCIEVCGLNEWDRFNNVIKELSNSDNKSEISKEEKLKIIYEETKKPLLIKK